MKWFRRRWRRVFDMRLARAAADLERHRREARELERFMDKLAIESEAIRKRVERRSSS